MNTTRLCPVCKRPCFERVVKSTKNGNQGRKFFACNHHPQGFSWIN